MQMAGRVRRRGRGRVNDISGQKTMTEFFTARSSPSIPVARGDTTRTETNPVIYPTSGETRSSTTNVNAGRVRRCERRRVNDMSGQPTMAEFFSRPSPSIPVASGDTTSSTTNTSRADRVNDVDPVMRQLTLNDPTNPIINPVSGETETRSSTTNVNAEGVVKVESQASLEAAAKQAQQEVYKKKCDEYYMGIACLAALKSKMSTPVGACIVDNESNIVGIGYNLIPLVKGGDSDEARKKIPSVKEGDSDEACKKDKELICATITAVKNKTIDALNDCTIYLTLHPDKEFAAHTIKLAGIKKVVYWMFPKKEGEKMKNVEKIFKANNIETREMTMSNENGVAQMLHNIMKKSKALEQIERPEQQGLEQQGPEQQGPEQQGPEQQGPEQLDVSSGPHGTITWDEFFMGIAILSSQAPITNRQYDKQSNKAVGACIVSSNNEVRAIGWSGYPDNMTHDDILQEGDQRGYIIHAERKAITRLPSDVAENCTLYVTSYPCHECAKLIVLYGIKEVVFDKDKGDSSARSTLQNVLTKKCELDEKFRRRLSSDLEKIKL